MRCGPLIFTYPLFPFSLFPLSLSSPRPWRARSALLSFLRSCAVCTWPPRPRPTTWTSVRRATPAAPPARSASTAGSSASARCACLCQERGRGVWRERASVRQKREGERGREREGGRDGNFSLFPWPFFAVLLFPPMCPVVQSREKQRTHSR